MKSIHPSLVAILCVLTLLPGLIFLGLRLALPGDASIPVIDLQRTGNDGVVVQSLSPAGQGLQKGDVVTAIQGRAVDQYMRELLSPRAPVGSSGLIEYTLRRGDRTLHLDAPEAVFPFAQLLRENWSIYLFLIYLELVSLVVFILRPRQSVTQIFFVISSLILSSSLTYFPGLRVDELRYPGMVILYGYATVVQYGLFLAGIVHLSLIFPKRHPLLVRHPGILLLIYLGVWLPLLLYMALRWGEVASPLGQLALIIQGTSFISVFFLPLQLVGTYSSYRTSSARERRQLRWLLWSLVVATVPYLIFTVAPSLLGLGFRMANSLMGLLWCTVPTSFAIAVLRERLFDIDVIIRRTLIYSILSVILGVFYLASILLLQGLFQTFTGRGQSELATVLSTLMIAALFTPLRGRIQDGIDRRFYRRKYDVEKMLHEFALTAREEVEFDRLTERLVEMVDESMEPQRLTLWIWKPAKSSRRQG